MIKYVLAAGLTITAATAAVVIAPPAVAAGGSTISVEQTVLVTFRAGSGERNDVRASYLGATTTDGRTSLRFAVSDRYAITPGSGCTVAPATGAPHRVTCVAVVPAGDSAGMRLFLGDGNDSATANLGTQGVELDGGSGNDRLRTTGRGYLYGRTGNDTLTGGDLADGGDGNDTIRLGDTAGGKALGGRGNDVLRGGNGRDTIFGNSGRDRIYGGRGGDELLGGPDDDVVYGNSGNDGVYGGPGKDRLSGGPGMNTVRQDAGPKQGDQPNP